MFCSKAVLFGLCLDPEERCAVLERLHLNLALRGARVT